MLEWFLVNEQFGRVTNGLHWHVPSVYNVWVEASPEQMQRYVRARAARRGRRRLRGHRGRRRLGPERDRHDRGRHRRRLAHQRREVVRHLRRRGPGADRGGQRRRRRRPPAHAVPGRAGRARAWSSSTIRSSPTTIPTATRRSASPTSRSPPTPSSAASATATSCSARWFTEERLGIATHGLGAMWRLLDETTEWVLDRRPGRAADHGLPGDLVPAGRLGHRRHASAGCWRCRSATWSTPTPIPSSSTPRPRWPSCSSPRRRAAAPTAPCRRSAGRGYLRSNVAERFNRELRVDRIWEGT